MTVSAMAYYSFLALILVLLAFAGAVVWRIVTGGIPLTGLISEPQDAGGKASLSRFQFLIFTFVIAGLFLMLSIEAGTFVEIPGNVLALLGISGGSFLVSKVVTAQEVQQNKAIDADKEKAEIAAGIVPPQPPAAPPAPAAGPALRP